MIVSKTPGVNKFRVHYGGDTIFISSDGIVESGSGIVAGEEREQILRDFEVLKSEPEWKEKEAESRKQLVEDEAEWEGIHEEVKEEEAKNEEGS